MENAKKLLEKIQHDHVTQKSRFEFTAKNVLFWMLFSASILIGGLAFSVMIFAFSQTEFDLIEHLTHSRIEFILSMLPILWIILTGIFAILSIWGVRHTKKGYKYSPLTVIGGSILCSIVLGTVFYLSGGAERFEAIFARNVPGYQSVEEKKLTTWSNPEQGFISGTIQSTGTTILLKDWNGDDWQIDTTNALIRGRASMNVGSQIKIIGELQQDNQFKAEEIRPWNGNGRNQGMH